jgi:hippurate hydrolase
MSGNGTFHIQLHGQGGHASQPECCKDPVLAAAAITMNLQQIVSRRMAPQSATVVSVTSIEAASSPTVTPEHARLDGSIRLARSELRAPINELIEQITLDTAHAYGVEAEIQIKPRYEATLNHAGPAARYRQALAEEFGEDWQASSVALPIMASEDFSYYLNAIPGAYALVGMACESEFQAPCHSPHYRFNDDVLAPVVRVFARLTGAPLP